MQIDNCFIASAGLGTRMGNIGKILPKPLWPVFEKTLLELQLEYVKKLGIKNIYVNSHHQHEKMMRWSKNLSIKLVHEETLLGSGGCIHNLKKKFNLFGKLLIINADQFLFFDKGFLLKALRRMAEEGAKAFLIPITVDPKFQYNETFIENDRLIKIEKCSGNKAYYTYSGVGIIDIDKLELVDGPSGFFQTVCDFKSETVIMSQPRNYEYWDFGTLERYIYSLEELLAGRGGQMSKFLMDIDVTIPVGNNLLKMLDGKFSFDLRSKSVEFEKTIDCLP